MAKLLGLLVSLVLTLLFHAQIAAAVQQCSECSHTIPCPGQNFEVVCPQELAQNINDLAALGAMKGNLGFVSLAACLAGLVEQGRIRLCYDMGTDFMQTRADCENRNVDPPKEVWCANSDNCICINGEQMIISVFGCWPSASQGDPVADAAMMAAALAHEACHAKTGVFCKAGGPYIARCRR